MKIYLCTDGVCIPPKCPYVDVKKEYVVIGEENNFCRLTKEQFKILKEKIISIDI